MTAERAKAALGRARFGRIEWVECTGSTNTDLVARARAGAPEQVLVADEQTAGRGRLGRAWVAAPGASLLCSILIREPGPAAVAHRSTMALGLAAANAVEEVAGVRLGLKWPNDLVALGAREDGADLKVSGMLAESVLDGDEVVAIVAGIGINVDWTATDLPPELAGSATSLGHLARRRVDRVDLLVAMLRSLDAALALRSDELMAGYVGRSATIGRRVRIEQAAGAWEGIAVALGVDGALVVEKDDGDRREVHAGDVVHLRPVHPAPQGSIGESGRP